jgi:hypothetical protein
VREIAHGECDAGMFQWAVMAATSQKKVLYDPITSIWLTKRLVIENPSLAVVLVHGLPAKCCRISGSA